MAAGLRKMQENQGFSDNRIDKLEFERKKSAVSCVLRQHLFPIYQAITAAEEDLLQLLSLSVAVLWWKG